MNIDHAIYYPSINNEFPMSEFEKAFYESELFYSFTHLAFIEDISHESILVALQKSLQVCRLAGINSKNHFKQIFVFDITIGALLVEWRMSKTGFNLLMIQMTSESEKWALWLWKLANHKVD